MKKTSQRSLLFRQNVGRTEETWAARRRSGPISSTATGSALSLRQVSGGAKEAGIKGWRERAADVFTDQGEIEAKKKFAPGSVPSDSFNEWKCGICASRAWSYRFPYGRWS